jgi:hypothetical protein
MLVNILLFVLIALRLWIGMRLFATAHNSNMHNLYWLVLLYVIAAVALPFAPTPGNPLGATAASLWLYQGIYSLGHFALIMFVTTTFYQKRRSPTEWFLGITVVAIVGTFYGLALSPSAAQLNPLVISLQVAVVANWGWHGWAGYQAWRRVAKECTVEDWVKARYQLVIWYSICHWLTGILYFAMQAAPAASLLGQILPAAMLLCNIGGVILAYLAWAAPHGFYRWLNRNYKPPITIDLNQVTEETVFGQS